MPGDDRLWLYDHQCRSLPVTPDTPQPHPEDSIGRRQASNRCGADRRKTPNCCLNARFSSRTSTAVLQNEDRTRGAVSSC